MRAREEAGRAAWLRGVARNVFLMHCRRERGSPERIVCLGALRLLGGSATELGKSRVLVAGVELSSNLRKFSYVFLVVILLVGIGGIIHNQGLNLGVDFSGPDLSAADFRMASRRVNVPTTLF